MNVDMVQRCPVGHDGVLPVDHIGCIKLGGVTQLLYIAYPDFDREGPWSHGLNIGRSSCIFKLTYVDSYDGSVLCDRVSDALSASRSAFAGHHFMCAEVGDFVAVGIGSNKMKRNRSSRLAAAVCFELQANEEVYDFHYYPGFGSLINQVRSCFSFHEA